MEVRERSIQLLVVRVHAGRQLRDATPFGQRSPDNLPGGFPQATCRLVTMTTLSGQFQQGPASEATSSMDELASTRSAASRIPSPVLPPRRHCPARLRDRSRFPSPCHIAYCRTTPVPILVAIWLHRHGRSLLQNDPVAQARRSARQQVCAWLPRRDAQFRQRGCPALQKSVAGNGRW